MSNTAEKIDIFDKAKAEKEIGELWFDGALTEDQARESAYQTGADFDMCEYWYGKKYHQMEASSHGYNS
ncbi:hypothetical protein [Aliikangiella coralliicola]|uniref:Uncharacterized protein n=1 Tax=Aliikangiella coralliicola TaxID=2592383 RepID=A0A545U034_9GAMM|nr:hypothetical protein [Aliikangiella coralliicola]TQV82824.1 hypothetical protein FLL46_23945 [Aliikangiella coralliicola]